MVALSLQSGRGCRAMPLVECDGCGKQVELTEEELTDPDPKGRGYCDCPNFMGWLEVGGPAWKDYHERGIHPMQPFIDAIKKRILN